ncbi:MAG: GxxExxY protein [Synoicihabitans sp.]
MDANRHESEEKMLHADLVYRAVGCCFEVIKEIGHGLHEKPYENALVIAFEDNELAVDQQRIYPISFRGKKVGEYIPDLVVDSSVVVDTKVIERITDHERGQMLNYLRITGLRVGLIVNFKHAKLEWQRVIL